MRLLDETASEFTPILPVPPGVQVCSLQAIYYLSLKAVYRTKGVKPGKGEPAIRNSDPRQKNPKGKENAHKHNSHETGTTSLNQRQPGLNNSPGEVPHSLHFWSGSLESPESLFDMSGFHSSSSLLGVE